MSSMVSPDSAKLLARDDSAETGINTSRTDFSEATETKPLVEQVEKDDKFQVELARRDRTALFVSVGILACWCLYHAFGSLLWINLAAAMPDYHDMTLPAALAAANITFSASNLSEPHRDFWFFDHTLSLRFMIGRTLIGSNLTLENDPMCGSACIKNSSNDSINICYFPLASGELLSDRSMSAACAEVYDDNTTAKTAQECSDWCEKEVFGKAISNIMFLSPTCEMFDQAHHDHAKQRDHTYMDDGIVSRLYKSCTRARLAKFSQQWFAGWTPWAVAVIYTLVSAVLALRLCEGSEDEKKVQWPEMDENVTLPKPFCCIDSKLIDSNAAKASATVGIAIKSPGHLVDNPLDVTMVFDYACKGQFVWLALTLSGMLPTFCQDPFQSKGVAALWQTWKRRLPTREYLEHQRREGLIEAPLAGFAVLSSIFFAYPYSLDWWTLLRRGASAFTSLVLAVPAAARAEVLLNFEPKDIFTDYKKMARAASEVPTFIMFGKVARLWGLSSLATLSHWADDHAGVAFVMAIAVAMCVLQPRGVGKSSVLVNLATLLHVIHMFSSPAKYLSSEPVWQRLEIVRDRDASIEMEVRVVAFCQVAGVALGLVSLVVGWCVWNLYRSQGFLDQCLLREKDPDIEAIE